MNEPNTNVPVVNTQGLCKEYVMGTMVVNALKNATVQIFRGEMVAIMGPSGSGKSTFMNLIGCLDRPTAGKFELDGKDVSIMMDSELAEIRNKYIGFIFQQFNLLARTSAQKNVELPLQYANASNRKERALAALERVSLGNRSDHKPNELSGGQQQRVAIARAIVTEPLMLLADEPTGALDSKTSIEIMAIFQDFNDAGTTVIVVTHEEEVAQHCKRIIRFRDGEIVSDEQVTNRIDARKELIARNLAEAAVSV